MKSRIETLTQQLDFLYQKLEQIPEEECEQQTRYLLTKIDLQRRLILEEEVSIAFKILEAE
jgi:hypothetical protein